MYANNNFSLCVGGYCNLYVSYPVFNITLNNSNPVDSLILSMNSYEREFKPFQIMINFRAYHNYNIDMPITRYTVQGFYYYSEDMESANNFIYRMYTLKQFDDIYSAKQILSFAIIPKNSFNHNCYLNANLIHFGESSYKNNANKPGLKGIHKYISDVPADSLYTENDYWHYVDATPYN